MGSVQEHHYAQNLCYMAKPSPDHKTLDDYAGHFLLYGLHHLHHQHGHHPSGIITTITTYINISILTAA